MEFRVGFVYGSLSSSMLWWSRGRVMLSRVDFWLLCIVLVDVKMVVGLLINVLLVYFVLVVLRKYLSGVVMLLNWVGLFSVRLV